MPWSNDSVYMSKLLTAFHTLWDEYTLSQQLTLPKAAAQADGWRLAKL